MKNSVRVAGNSIRRSSVVFVIVTVLLVLLVAGLFSETVKCRNYVEDAEMEAFYLEQEQDMVEAARILLAGKGYENSGVMLTRVVEEDGSRQYTLTVHHGRINSLGAAEQQELLGQLASLDFEDEHATFFHEFLAVK